MSTSIFKKEGSLLFYICFLIYFILSGFLSIVIPKAESFIWINHWRSFPADIFFSMITYCGNGFFIAFLVLLFFILKLKKTAILIAAGYIVSGIIALWLKHYFNYPRPAGYFSDPDLVRSAPWVTLYHQYSFPSGHTISVFTTAVIISLFFREKKWIAVLCFAIACLTAYSRVYLGEHFIMDTWMGSLIGVLTGTCCFLVQQRILKKKNDYPKGGRLGK